MTPLSGAYGLRLHSDLHNDSFAWRAVCDIMASMHWKIGLILLAGTLFSVSAAGFACVRLFLRPKEDSDLDTYYYEFEDQHPDLARYNKWSRITLTGVIIGMLLLFLTMVF